MLAALFTSETIREDARRDLRERIQKASSPEWAALWSADLAILEGAPDVGIQTFRALTSSPRHEIALSALFSLGQYYQFVGQLDRAIVTFREAYDRADGVRERIRAIAHLTGVMTETCADHEIIDLSAEWLAALDDVFPDWVQHLMADLGTALVRVGRRADGEAMMRRMVEAFP